MTSDTPRATARPLRRGRKPKQLGLRRKQARTGLAFVSPFIVGLIVYFIMPVVQSIGFSFSNIEVTGTGFNQSFAGLENYYRAFAIDPDFRQTLVSSILEMAAQVPLIVIFSFFAATLLNRPFRGRGLARTVFFLPVILTTGVILAIETSDMLIGMAQQTVNAAGEVSDQVSGFQSLQLRAMLVQSGLDPRFISYITGAIDSIYSVITASGVQILVFLAGLQSIPASLYEAAVVEGASGWETFWKITFPMVSPLILVNVIYSIVDAFTKPTNAMMQAIQTTAFELSYYGYSAAMAWIYFATILVMLGIVSFVISRYVFYHQ